MNGVVTRKKSEKSRSEYPADDTESAKAGRFAVRFKNETQFFNLAQIIDDSGGSQHVLERLIPWWAALDDVTRAMLIGAIKPRADLIRLIVDREARLFHEGKELDVPSLPAGSKPRDGGPAGDKPRGESKK